MENGKKWPDEKVEYAKRRAHYAAATCSMLLAGSFFFLAYGAIKSIKESNKPSQLQPKLEKIVHIEPVFAGNGSMMRGLTFKFTKAQREYLSQFDDVGYTIAGTNIRAPLPVQGGLSKAETTFAHPQNLYGKSIVVTGKDRRSGQLQIIYQEKLDYLAR